jgi:hypothetical protein
MSPYRSVYSRIGFHTAARQPACGRLRQAGRLCHLFDICTSGSQLEEVAEKHDNISGFFPDFLKCGAPNVSVSFVLEIENALAVVDQ